MPEIIIYPPYINTDFDKLCAVYSLLEQLRLEHNRVGAMARGDWERYQGKWAEYARIFKQKQLALLQEQNRLRSAIRKGHYADVKWRALTLEERHLAFQAIYGDKQALKVSSTGATSSLLDELKAVSLDSLGASFSLDPTEDFTTYTEVDPNSDITVTASRCTVDTMRNDVTAYVRKDYGADHFTDFEHLVAINVSTFNEYASIGWWGLDDGEGTYTAREVTHRGITLWSYSTGRSLNVYDHDEWFYDSSPNLGGVHYLTMARSEGTFTVAIYSDSDRTNLEDTLSIASTAAYRYVCSVNSRGGSGSVTGSGYVEDLDLQEAPEIIEKSSGDSGSGAESKVSGNPVAVFSKSETGSGTEGTSAQAAALSKSEIGSGADSSSSLFVEHVTGESGSGADVLTALLAGLVQADSGTGLEQSLLSLLLSSAESGSASDAVVSLLSELLKGDSGSGADVVVGRDLVLQESGSGTDSLPGLLATILGSETGGGLEQSLLSIIVAKVSADIGSGMDASALIRAFVSGDGGIGSELGKLWKDILGIDGGTGGDALKTLVAAAGSSMRLPGRRGQVSRPSSQTRKPSKGVNL
jgi:hypothetical protein